MNDSPDVLYLSLGTTFGLRVADTKLVLELQEAGASVEVVAVRIGVLNALRKGYPLNDWIEALASRRALESALERIKPRSCVISTTTAALLAPQLTVPYAVRLDSPALLNRPGTRNRPQHLLERRRFGRAHLILPFSKAAQAMLPSSAARSIVVPPPLRMLGPPPAERDHLAVAYTPDPKAKGLDVVCAAWSAARVEGARLEVFGVEPELARRHLRRRGIAEPERVVWRGRTPPDEFRATLRRAQVFVQGARWEDYGQAPLEALADGALLATVPCGGPYEALRIARALNPDLAAHDASPISLAACLQRAFELPDDRAHAYRTAAASQLAPYGPEAVGRTVAEEVLPALLG